MELKEQIEAAARQLGQSLRQDDYVRTYLDALKETQTDPEASALEKQMHDVYEALIARQQAEEGLDGENILPFCKIRREAQNHPLISRRNDMLRLLRPYLSQIADEISLVLGADYTKLALPQ